MDKDMAELINIDKVERVAQLARLELSTEEKTLLVHELQQILEHFQAIERIDTDQIEPTYHPHKWVNQLRQDEAIPSRPRENWLELAGKSKDGMLIVPRTVD